MLREQNREYKLQNLSNRSYFNHLSNFKVSFYKSAVEGQTYEYLYSLKIDPLITDSEGKCGFHYALDHGLQTNNFKAVDALFSLCEVDVLESLSHSSTKNLSVNKQYGEYRGPKNFFYFFYLFFNFVYFIFFYFLFFLYLIFFYFKILWLIIFSKVI
jgi:hypothetical protein